MAVSKTIMSARRHSHTLHAASVLPKAKFLTPIVRDKMPEETAHKQSHVPYPNVVCSHHIMGSQSLSLKMNISKQHAAISVVTGDKRRVSAPGAWTTPCCQNSHLPIPHRPTPSHCCQEKSLNDILSML